MKTFWKKSNQNTNTEMKATKFLVLWLLVMVGLKSVYCPNNSDVVSTDRLFDKMDQSAEHTLDWKLVPDVAAIGHE